MASQITSISTNMDLSFQLTLRSLIGPCDGYLPTCNGPKYQAAHQPTTLGETSGSLCGECAKVQAILTSGRNLSSSHPSLSGPFGSSEGPAPAKILRHSQWTACCYQKWPSPCEGPRIGQSHKPTTVALRLPAVRLLGFFFAGSIGVSGLVSHLTYWMSGPPEK